MLKFDTEKVSENITRFYAFGTELVYLIEGSEKNALIDTGSGFGSLKKAVDEVLSEHGNKNPLEVFLSHGHIDHAGGAGEFTRNGIPVYMNPDDEYIYNRHMSEEFRRDGISMENFEGHGEYIEEEDYIPSADFSDINPLLGGDVINLGDVKIEVYSCKGHTLGSVVFLIHNTDNKTYLFTGDACNLFTFVFDTYSTSIEEYEESLKALKPKIDGKYDEVLISHGDGKGYIGMIEDVIDVCEKIKLGQVDAIPFEFGGAKGNIAFAPNPENMKGNIVFSPQRILKESTKIF